MGVRETVAVPLSDRFMGRVDFFNVKAKIPLATGNLL
jgi:hypothetical protein